MTRTPAPRFRLPHVLTALLATAVVLLATACGGGADAAPKATGAPLHVVDRAPEASTDGAAGHAPSHADHAGEHPTALPADGPLPGESLYHLDASWTDHRGEELVLSELRGHPVVIVMLYASCESACPILVRDALSLDEALPEAARAETRFLMVTFDTERDAPERLAAYVEENGLEDPRWRFAVGDASSTRALAAMLGVRYRPAGNGMFSHSNLITVLDEGGVPARQVEGLGRPSDPLVDAIVAARR